MSEQGSIFPLIAGLLALALASLLAVSSVSTLSVERHRLTALAEATALRAAESFDPSTLTREGGRVRASLRTAAVAVEAKKFLEATPHDFESLRLLRADSPDGQRARIVLEAVWRAPYLSQWLPAQLTIRAEAWARSVIS